MADFNKAFNETIIPNEGKYSNDKNDNGGETVYGLTRKDDVDWEGWKIVDNYKGKSGYPNNLPYSQLLLLAQSYYKKKYWDYAQMDYAQMDKFPSQDLAKKIFSISVNMGKSIAIMFLQRALNVLNHNGKDYPNITIDGIFGTQTLSNVLKCNVTNVLDVVKSLQGARYVALSESNSKLQDFTNGWINRMRDEG